MIPAACRHPLAHSPHTSRVQYPRARGTGSPPIHPSPPHSAWPSLLPGPSSLELFGGADILVSNMTSLMPSEKNHSRVTVATSDRAIFRFAVGVDFRVTMGKIVFSHTYMYKGSLVTVLKKKVSTEERPCMWDRAGKVSTEKPTATQASVATGAVKAELVKVVPPHGTKKLTVSLKKARS